MKSLRIPNEVMSDYSISNLRYIYYGFAGNLYFYFYYLFSSLRVVLLSQDSIFVTANTFYCSKLLKILYLS